MDGKDGTPIESEDTKARSGEEERNYSKIRATDGYYILIGKGEQKERFHVTDEQVEKAFMLYCIAKLTISQVATEMGWSRKEFYALKTAFNITHDELLPFTPEVIDITPVEELIEKVRIFKKRYANIKIKANTDKDIKREINRMNKTKFWFDKVLEVLKPMEIEPKYVIVEKCEHISDDVQFKVDITDIHNGLQVDSIYNKNNPDITDARMEAIGKFILENVPKDNELLLVDKGDMIHGLIHGSTEKYSDFVVFAVNRICRAYVMLIKMLLDAGYRVKFQKINGNHESIEKNKKNRTDEESFGNILPMVLEVTFANHENFTIIGKLKGTVHSLVVTKFGYGILLAHGDECSMERLAKKAREIGDIEDIKIIEVSAGHIHHYKAENIDGILVEYTEALCGTDQYASGKGFHMPPGFRITWYNKTGRIGTRFINLKGVDVDE